MVQDGFAVLPIGFVSQWVDVSKGTSLYPRHNRQSWRLKLGVYPATNCIKPTSPSDYNTSIRWANGKNRAKRPPVRFAIYFLERLNTYWNYTTNHCLAWVKIVEVGKMAVFSSVLIDWVFWGLFYESLWDFEFDYFSDCLCVHRVGVFQMITVLDFFAYRVIVAELLFYRRKKSPDSFGESMGFFYRHQHGLWCADSESLHCIFRLSQYQA